MKILNPISFTLPYPNISELDDLCTRYRYFFMEEEIWKDIKGYYGVYQISNLGNVKSKTRYVKRRNNSTMLKKGVILKPGLSASGYLSVSLKKNTIAVSHCIHRLIAEYFIDNPLSLDTVHHIDENKINNSIANLEWVSHRYNISLGFKNGTSKYVGVHLCSYNQKWKAAIKVKDKSIFLGEFKKEIEAHNAYQNALKKYGIINRNNKLAGGTP